MFNPLNFNLRIQYIYDSGIYYTVVDKEEVDAFTIEALFEKVAKLIKKYQKEHLFNDTD